MINTEINGNGLLAWSDTFLEDDEVERLVKEKHGDGWELVAAFQGSVYSWGFKKV